MKAARITVHARAVVAAGSRFVRRGEAYSDPDVAMDEVLSLRAAQEPVVLRVAATGVGSHDRFRLSGDWLCDADGSEPRKIRRPIWHSSSASRRWSARMPLIRAWETCEEAEWMVRLLCDMDRSDAPHGVAGVPPSLAAAACCACVREAAGTSRRVGRPVEAALELAEAAVGGASVTAASLTHAILSSIRWVEELADGEADTALGYAASDAARSARWARFGQADELDRWAAAGATHEAVTAASLSGVRRTRSMADVVRSSVPTVDLLRGAALRRA